MSGSRFGEPIEVPWWVPLGAVPPAAVVIGALVWPGPLVGRVVGVLFSVLMLWVLVAVSTRVRSPSMQSVWVSAGYAVWVFAAVVWLVSAIRP